MSAIDIESNMPEFLNSYGYYGKQELSMSL